MIIGHGDDGYLYKKNIVANFSSNVYYGGFPEGMKAQLISAIDTINNYPEANAQSLQHNLARWHAVAAEQVLITNGATESFYIIAHCFRNKTATIIIPSFAEYEDACVKNDLNLQFLNWDKLNENTLFNTTLAFLGNPNNPTGKIIAAATLKHILKHNPQTSFVIDEAYVDFTNEQLSLVNELPYFENLILVRSLTKTYAIPGLRLGYILSTATAIKNISYCKFPWSVNTLAVVAGNYIVQHKARLVLPLTNLLNDTGELISQLNQLAGITANPTRTNFFLAETSKGTAAELKAFLLDRFGLLIRDASNFRGLTPKHFRIATQTSEKNELLLKGIRQWLARF